MACELKSMCDFYFGFLRCSQDIIDVEIMVRTIQGIYTFRKDHNTESSTCSPWSRQMQPFPSLCKKIKALEEEKKGERSLFHPNPNKFSKKPAPSNRSRHSAQRAGKSKVRRLDMSRFAPPKAKRPTNLWAPLPSSKSAMATTTTTTMTANSRVTTISPMMSSICKMCKRWGPPCPFCVKSALHPSPQESDWSDDNWDGDIQSVRKQKKKADSNFTIATETTTAAAQTAIDHLSDTTTDLMCELCKPVGDPCPFAIKPVPTPSLSDSEDCYSSKEREYRKTRELQNVRGRRGEDQKEQHAQ